MKPFKKKKKLKNKRPTKVKQSESETIKIKLVATFTCAVYQNVINISNALMQAGRFVNVDGNGFTSYTVKVYERYESN